MLIVSLIPFILAARVKYPSSSWKDGEKAQVTYLIQDHAVKTYSVGSDSSDEIFYLKALLTCQFVLKQLNCYFHDVEVKTIFAEGKQGLNTCPKFVHEDMYIKKSLLQVELSAELTSHKFMVVWIPKELDIPGRHIMMSLFEPLNLGLNFSAQLTGNFEIKGNSSIGRCKTRYLVTRSVDQNEVNNSDMELFLIGRPEEPRNRPVEILRKVEDDKCANEFFYLYSPFAAREFKTIPTNLKIEMRSIDGFMTITRNNFTSYGKNVFSVTDNKDNTKYVVDESLSLTLQKIEEIKCDESKNAENCINDGLKKRKVQLIDRNQK